MDLVEKYQAVIGKLKPMMGLSKDIKIVLPATDDDFKKATSIHSQGVLAAALRGDELYFSPEHQTLMRVFDGAVTATNEAEVLAVKLVVHELGHLLKAEPGWDDVSQQHLGEAITEAYALWLMAHHVPYEGSLSDYLSSLDRTALYRKDVMRLVQKLSGESPKVLGDLIKLDGEEMVRRLGTLKDVKPTTLGWLWQDLQGGNKMSEEQKVEAGSSMDIGNINDIARGLAVLKELGAIQDIGNINDIARGLAVLKELGAIQDIGNINDIAQVLSKREGAVSFGAMFKEAIENLVDVRVKAALEGREDKAENKVKASNDDVTWENFAKLLQ